MTRVVKVCFVEVTIIGNALNVRNFPLKLTVIFSILIFSFVTLFLFTRLSLKIVAGSTELFYGSIYRIRKICKIGQILSVKFSTKLHLQNKKDNFRKLTVLGIVPVSHLSKILNACRHNSTSSLSTVCESM
jgi:hypothetical protein